MRILVVEDRLNQRIAFGELLRDEDHEVLEASGGRAALAQFAEAPVDLVLLDYTLSDMTASELVEQLHRVDASQGRPVQCPVVLVSASAEVVVDADGGTTLKTCREEMRSLGVADWVERPIDWGALLAVIAKHNHGQA